MNLVKEIKKFIEKNQDKKVADTFFVAIDGRGGVGKTTLAEVLGKELDAEIIHTDDFASWDNPIDWWTMVVEKVFEPIADGAKVLNYARSSWAVSHKPKSVVNQPVMKIMIIEGVGASRKEFDGYIGLSIFVDTPKDICLKRGMERDNGQYPNDELKMKWQKWAKIEEKHFAKDVTKSRALMMVDGVDNFKIKNNKIKQ